MTIPYGLAHALLQGDDSATRALEPEQETANPLTATERENQEGISRFFRSKQPNYLSRALIEINGTRELSSGN